VNLLIRIVSLRTRYPIVGFCLVLAGSTPLVYADIAPLPAYDGDCTVDKQQSEGEECISCTIGWGQNDTCKTLSDYENEGYTNRCRTAEQPQSIVERLIYCRPATGSESNNESEPDTTTKSNDAGVADATVKLDTAREQNATKTDDSNCNIAGVARGSDSPTEFLLLACVSIALFVRRYV